MATRRLERVLFLNFDSVMRPLGHMFSAADSVQWLYRIAESLAGHADVGIVLFGAWQETYPPRSGMALVHALGKRFAATVTERGGEGAIEGYLRQNPHVVDFVVLADIDTMVPVSLQSHCILAEPAKGLWDPGASELSRWLDGARRSREPGTPSSRQDDDVARGPADTCAVPRWPRPVQATVSLVIEEFQLVHLDGPDGTTLSIGEGTEGVDWQQLQLGMKLECELEGYHGVRVVRARVLPTSAPGAPATGEPGGREP